MRLVSYNILDGGEGRADPLAEVILAQKPDIVALVEADNLAVVERIAQRGGMDFIHAPGETSAAALLSRWTIGRTINHALLRRGMEKSLLQADLIDPTGAEWSVGVVHLHARTFEADERIREKEITTVLDVFADHRSNARRHLLVGDFNSNAPYQQIDPKHCKAKTRDAWAANGNLIPRRVVQTILDAGYLDSLRQFDPKKAETLGSFTTQHPGQRLDYIFTFGIESSSIRRAWIEQDRLAKYASDHFPVGIEIA